MKKLNEIKTKINESIKQSFLSNSTEKRSQKKTRRKYQTFSEKEKGGSNSLLKLTILGLPKDLEGKNVLDIGCNAGFFSFECEKRKADVIGIEKNRYWFNEALKKKEQLSSTVNFIKMDWSNLHKINEKFDLVLFLASFHYVKEDHQELLKNIFDKMNEDGLLILDIGLSDKKEGNFFMDARKRPRTGKICQYPNKFTIRKLLDNAGFKKILFFNESNIMKDFVPRHIIHAIK